MRYYNATEIAILANLSESAVRAAIKRGELGGAAYKHRGRAVWPADAVAAFLDYLRTPRPLADRRMRLPEMCETR